MNIDRVKIDENGNHYSVASGRRYYGLINKCLNCKISFLAHFKKIRKGGGRYCSNKCQMAIQANAKYFNGKLLNERGYVIVKQKGDKAMKSGYCYEHRLVAEEKLGRPLLKSEIVHHIDGNKLNNHPANLMVMTQGDHMRWHKIHRKSLQEAMK